MSNKTLVIMAHPNIDTSIFNKYIKEDLQKEENIVYKDLSSLYEDFKLDVKKEQEELLSASKIVFQFPLQWYSSPAILKQYVDLVFDYDFAYTVENGFFEALKLKGKEFQLLVTVGSKEESFTGEERLSVKECLSSYSYTAKMLGMKELEACFIYGTVYEKFALKEFNEISKKLKEYIL